MLEAAEHRKTEKEINAEKTALVAKGLYPNEKWEFLEEGIYIAKSRQPTSARELSILEDELRQARILVARGSTVYFLPESEHPVIKNKKYPDAVVDGNVMEFKAITGGLRMVKKRYKKAKEKKVNYVFLLIDSELSPDFIKLKLSDYIKRKGYAGGIILVYFSKTDEFHQWTEDELAAIENDE